MLLVLSVVKGKAGCLQVQEGTQKLPFYHTQAISGFTLFFERMRRIPDCVAKENLE